jgi:uncharacterized protein (DUF1778 family)
MLRDQGRAHTGAQNILRSLSAMSEDAITDEVAEVNFVRGVRVRASDPRVRGATRPPRVFGFDELRRFAAHGGEHEPMLRVFTDCGLRLGEVLGLERGDFDGAALHLRGSAHAGVFTPGDQPTKRHVRTVPCPPSTAEPPRIDTPLLFPTPAGRIWHESNFRRDVWIRALAAHLGHRPLGERVVVGLRGARPGGDQGVEASDQATRLPPLLDHPSASHRHRRRRPSRSRRPHRRDNDRHLHTSARAVPRPDQARYRVSKVPPTVKTVRRRHRLSPIDDELFRQAAVVLGQSVSEFLIESGRQRAEAILCDRTRFALDQEAWTAFAAALDRPAQANSAVIRLMRRARPE